MKKSSIVLKEVDNYKIIRIINNIALVENEEGQRNLLNIKTNSLIGEFGKYRVIYDNENKLYILAKENEEQKEVLISIYDVLKEKMVVNDYKLIASYDNKYAEYYKEIVIEDPSTGKKHFFYLFSYRSDVNILDMAFDKIEFVKKHYNSYYYLFTNKGKTGLFLVERYEKKAYFKSKIEYDRIDALPNIFVYTKDGIKYFNGLDDDSVASEVFRDIEIDAEHKNIAYCKMDGQFIVYNTYTEQLLLREKCDEVKVVARSDDKLESFSHNYLFLIREKEKYGLIRIEVFNSRLKKSKITKEMLLEIENEKIEWLSSGDFVFQKNGKVGLLIYKDMIEPIYDEIDYLGNNFYGCYKENVCDIYYYSKMAVEDCIIKKNLKDNLIYEKNGLLGLIYTGEDRKVIEAKYDDIERINEYYFKVWKDGKCGLVHLGVEIIPLEYKDIRINKIPKKKVLDITDVYFMLLRDDGYFELAKKEDCDYKIKNVEFLDGIKLKNVEFYQEIMAFIADGAMSVYDYEGHLLKTFRQYVKIEQFSVKVNYSDEYYYLIDGDKYYIRDGKFRLEPRGERNVYVTFYEIGNETFELRTINKREHDEFCLMIDGLDDKEALRSLKKMLEGGHDKLDRYPTLVLKRIKND